MNTWAVVPVKPFNRAKSRLSAILDAKQREAFSRAMLERTLTVLKQVQGISGVLVISRDSDAITLARRLEVQTVQESGTPELNAALTRATNVLATWNARGILVLASDMPLLRAEDIEGMLELARVSPVVAVASDRRKEGTNALLVRPPGLIPYRYGEKSFEKHIAEARALGVDVHIYHSPALELDIDIPEDLQLYRSILAERDLAQPVWLSSM